MAAKKSKPVPVTASKQAHEVRLRLPQFVMVWIEERARNEGRPINSVIASALAEYPQLEKRATQDMLNRRLEAMLNMSEVAFARYAAEINWHLLSNELLDAIDTVLAMEAEGDTRSAFAQLRLVRAEMKQERSRQRLHEAPEDPEEE